MERLPGVETFSMEPAIREQAQFPAERERHVTASEDERWMRAALDQAGEGQQRGEVPVGAVIVSDGAIVGEGFNQPIGSSDATAHAEVVAIRDAGRRLGNYRLSGATMYVTIEPCQMCVGAMIHARIARVVYGTPEPKAGAIESAMRAHEHPALNHRLTATGGVLEAECRAVMQEFFKSRRSPRG
jgi:tRNA(adenine34) deaminase